MPAVRRSALQPELLPVAVSEPCVEVLAPGTETAALELLFRDQLPDDRRESIADLRLQRDAGDLTFEESWVALDGDRVTGVLFTVPHGRTGRFVWPPVLTDGADEATADRLLGTATAQFELEGVEIAQVLGTLGDNLTPSRLERAGFEWIADLEFMQRVHDVPIPELDGRLEIETYDPPHNHRRFEEMLAATYVDTLDCPQLGDRRSVPSTLDGHRASGVFDPRRWVLFRANGVDVGILLLADHPTENAWEVVYVGVHHEHRGLGYGRAMIVNGLRAARDSGREATLLAVDTRNVYAIDTYTELGFVPLVRRRAFVWFGTDG